MRKLLALLLILIGLFAVDVRAQEGSSKANARGSFGEIEERRLLESKWRYTYAIHLESNTTIHKAENFYEYYLYFRYNYTYQQYLNGRLTKGRFKIEDRELVYSFKHIKKFVVAELSRNRLILEFTQPNSKGTYQYHFVKVESKDAPFIKPANELPDVIVEMDEKKKSGGLFSFVKRKSKKKKKKKKKRKKYKDDRVYINIELIGGGYYGGIDPVLRDYIHIKSDGRLIKEFKTVSKGLNVTRKDIPREELEAFAEFVDKKGFFELERIYDCDNSICQKRKQEKPRPIPLRLAIAYGKKKKVITLSIWGKDRHKVQYVDYPPALEAIIEAIQRMAHRIEANES